MPIPRIFVRKFLGAPGQLPELASRGVPRFAARRGGRTRLGTEWRTQEFSYENSWLTPAGSGLARRGVCGQAAPDRTGRLRGAEMTLSLFLACLWAIVANVLAMLPSRDNHWTRACVLMGLGLPLLGFVAWENGPWAVLAMLVAGMSLLRWPLRFLLRWLRGKVRRQG